METAAFRCYGTGSWGSDWKLQQCHVTAPVSGVPSGNCISALLRHRRVGSENCSSAILRHQWQGVSLETAAVRRYGDGWGSEFKLQQCDVTSPVARCLTANCSSVILRHRWLGV